MINLIISFSIESSESLDFVQEIISDFIAEIEKNEPDTVLYKSFRSTDSPNHFFHVMTFKDENAQTFHQNSSYCKEFVSKLYPLCIEEPKVVSLIEIGKN